MVRKEIGDVKAKVKAECELYKGGRGLAYFFSGLFRYLERRDYFIK
jgi:hypothetical protein